MVSLSAAFAAVLLSAAPGQTVMLDFSADWCAPCHAMDPTVHNLEAMGYPVRRVNVDQQRELADQFQVKRIPCFVMLVDGREVDRVVGGTTFSRLNRMCKLAAPAPARGGEPGPLPLAASGPMLPVPPLRTGEAAAARPAVSDAALIAASVRLRVEDPDGRSCGTGTIIDARQGEALILTCGHLFRDSQGKGRIEVDLFGSGGRQRVAGTLLSYDLVKDVGLVKIAAAGPVATARVAPPSRRVAPDEKVITVGCNNGDDPTARHSRVLAVDKFQGPPNLQTDGEPVEGRSGGGVFSSDGLLVGICNAADHNDHAGYCAALPTIYAELDRASVSFVYKDETSLAAVSPLPAKADQPVATGATPVLMCAAGASPGPAEMAKLAPREQAAIDEVQRGLKEGAEVVCVIRNARDPQAKSEVIVLNSVSGAFLDRLTANARLRENCQPTSLEVKPILEWDATDGYRHNEPLPVSSQPR